MNDLFLRACKRQRVERTPVWMMRQAGRYLPEYRAIRAKADFLTMCKTPELAAEVTVQPVDIIGVDAAIIFSDILVVPEAMGLHLEMIEAKGPRFLNPVRTQDDIDALRIPDPEKNLRYVMQALETTKRILGKRVPLIGFAGSPWTLAAYMIEGSGGKEWKHTKRMMLDQPELMMALLDKLADSVRLYLEAQLAAGADAIQIFDTWGGVLTPDHYKKFSLEYIHAIVAKLHRNGQPVIVFSKGANHSLKDIADIGADVVGIDWTIDMADAKNQIGEQVALQGNLDPSYLYGSPSAIRREVKSILKKFGKGSGHVFNLGHGIFPDVPVEHARAMVDAVKEESVSFHGS
ncbi:MAG: uroporphyrinogen decarboxylase [Ignavibacteriae bacterium]|nr:uroporphyrinogen decarboxylase [Ignavibacteriota bacterium]